MFSQRETRDELGIAPIRDALSDRYFPGTSTVQTRARYFLFIPWIYQNLERKQLEPNEVSRRLRKEELKLRDALVDSDDPSGTVGKLGGKSIKRPPSSIYWRGLGTLGIRLFAGTMESYHRSWAKRSALRQAASHAELGQVSWHPHLPRAPDGFPEGASFNFTAEEADYLRERFRSRAPDCKTANISTRGAVSPAQSSSPIAGASRKPTPGTFSVDSKGRRRMLDPRDRLLLLESLRPPEGYILDGAVGTSFSLDLLSVLTVPLAFTFYDWENVDGEPSTDPLALLEAVRRNADRLHIFCQAGAIKVPPQGRLLFSYLEQSTCLGPQFAAIERSIHPMLACVHSSLTAWAGIPGGCFGCPPPCRTGVCKPPSREQRSATSPSGWCFRRGM